jgi:hypothetical protein
VRHQAKCSCGRPRSEAAVKILRLRASRHTYHLCSCGAEWAEHTDAANLTEPISSEEVLSVHEFLATFDGAFCELVSPTR